MAASPRLHLGFSPARFSAIRANFSAKLDAREAPHLHLSNDTGGSARIVAITAITAGHRERRNSSPRRSAAAILLCRSVHQARKRGSSPWFQGAAFFIRPKKRDRYRAALARIRGTSVTSARSTVHPSYAGKSPRGSNCKAILFFVAPHGPTMADTEAEHIDAVEEELEAESNYKPPPEKTIEQLLEADKEDESLKKYKETLLGEAKSGGIVVDPEDPRKVIVKKLALCVAGRPDMELDLTGDLSQLKKQTFIIKEGVSYKIRIDFIVQREIVHGLKYVQKTYRLGVLVDKMTHMVGSYPPKKEIQSYTTPSEDAPAGMIARGSYFVSSLFTDDDKHEHLNWEWPFVIKKDWQE